MKLTNVIAALVLAGNFGALVSRHELWPFSPYPMYSRPRTSWTLRMLRPVGVDSAGAEVQLDTPASISPFTPYGLDELFRRMPEAQRPAALHALLDLYKTRMPTLQKLRLYEMIFDSGPQAHPERRERAKLLSQTLVSESP